MMNREQVLEAIANIEEEYESLCGDESIDEELESVEQLLIMAGLQGARQALQEVLEG